MTLLVYYVLVVGGFHLARLGLRAGGHEPADGAAQENQPGNPEANDVPHRKKRHAHVRSHEQHRMAPCHRALDGVADNVKARDTKLEQATYPEPQRD